MNKMLFHVADFLNSHKDVEQVLYPGLTQHPGYSVAKKQMSGFSGMLSFSIKGGKKRAIKFLKNLKIFYFGRKFRGCGIPGRTSINNDSWPLWELINNR